MLIVVMNGRWSDDSTCILLHDVRLYSVVDTMVIYGENVWYSGWCVCVLCYMV